MVVRTLNPLSFIAQPLRLCVESQYNLNHEEHSPWQMALLGRAMEARAGAGVGWIQVRVISSFPPSLAIGLAPTSMTAIDHHDRGLAGGGSWGGEGDVHWNLPGPAPASNTVKFGQGDRVMVVLDCRTEPLVRLLVNYRACLIHHLTTSPTSTPPIAVFYPAIALGAGSRVDLEPSAPLPDGWDATPT